MSKDEQKPTKTSLMDELKSIKGVLNEDDDNIPLLLGDDDSTDIPVLSDDDIPVLTSAEDEAASSNRASLDAAIRQLESMELSPKANKARLEKPASVEEQIRSNAAPPLFDDKATTVRENPFLKKPTDRFSKSRQEAEDALKSVIAHSKALSKPTKTIPDPRATLAVKDNPAETPVEFSDNQFLKSSAAPHAKASAAPTGIKQNTQEEDASSEILKLLGEEPVIRSSFGMDDEDDFGEPDIDARVDEKLSKSKEPVKKTDEQIDAVIDEVIEEYMIILEAALKKKLKEKVPDLLKK